MTSRPPSVDRLARSLAASGLPHPILVDIARRAIAAAAHETTTAANGCSPTDDGSAPNPTIEERAHAEVAAFARTMLQPVINATGVLLHTNLGRAPFAPALNEGYTNLELDLATGERGSRHAHAGALLMARACGAEAAIIVNNCAAAVLLVLAALATRPRRGGVARRAGRDRRRVPGPRGHGAVRRSPRRGRHHQPHPRGRLRRAIADPRRCRARDAGAPQSNYRIVGFHRSARPSKSSPHSACHSSPTSARGYSTRRARGSRTARRRGCGGEPAARQTLEAGAGARHLLRRQAARRTSGRHHRRPRRSRRGMCQASAGSRAAPRRARAARDATAGARLPPPRRRRHPVLADGHALTVDELRARAAQHLRRMARGRRQHGRARWRHAARRRDPVRRSRARWRSHCRAAGFVTADHRPGQRGRHVP